MSSIHYKHGFTVRPKSMASIATLAADLRRSLGIRGYCQIDVILEFGWRNFIVYPEEMMGENLGLTNPDGTIILREDVYEGVCSGDGFHRFTVAHEIGHVTMHLDQIGFARTFQPEKDKVYCNSEWQANEFAGELLVPRDEVRMKGLKSAYEIVNTYGVSLECAATRLKKIWGH